MASPRSNGGTNRLKKLANEYFAEMNNLWEWSNRWANIIRNGNSVNPSGLHYIRAAAFIDYIDDKRTAIQNIVDPAVNPDVGTNAINLQNYMRALPDEDPNRNLVADHQATLTALTTCGNWLINNLPTDVSWSSGVTNNRVDYTGASAAQVEPFALLLDALNATIEF